MIDLYWTRLNFGLALLFSIAYFLFVISFYRKRVSCPQWQQSKMNWGQFLFSLLLIIIVSTGNTSDWFSYQQVVWNYDFRVGGVNHGERVYYYIVKFVNKNYLLFRIVVWGGAFLLTCWTFKRFKVNINIAAYLLVSAFLLRFNYARATLGMSSYFLGLSFILKPIKKFKITSLALAALFFWGSYEFHQSMLPILFLTITAFVPLNKYSLIVLIVLLPLASSYVNNHFQLVDYFGNETISSRFNSYTERVTNSSNLLGIITNIFGYGSFVVPIAFISFVVSKYNKSVELPLLRLYRVTIIISLFAASFLFMSLGSEFFVYRYLFVTFIPIATLSTYLYEKRLLNRLQFYVSTIIGIIYHAIAFLVSLSHTL